MTSMSSLKSMVMSPQRTASAPPGSGLYVVGPKPESKSSFVKIEEDEAERKSVMVTVDRLLGIPGTHTVVKSRKSGGSMVLPPSLESTPRVVHTFRFQATSSSAANVTVDDIIGALGCVCSVTNSVVRSIASSFRIRSITIWPASVSTALPVAANVTWSAAASVNEPDSQESRLMPEGVTITGGMKFIPPPKSLGSFWWNGSSSGTLFYIQSPTGSVVDVALDFTLHNTLTQESYTVATATLGYMYYLALDGPSTNIYTPVNLPTTS